MGHTWASFPSHLWSHAGKFRANFAPEMELWRVCLSCGHVPEVCIFLRPLLRLALWGVFGRKECLSLLSIIPLLIGTIRRRPLARRCRLVFVRMALSSHAGVCCCIGPATVMPARPPPPRLARTPSGVGPANGMFPQPNLGEKRLSAYFAASPSPTASCCHCQRWPNSSQTRNKQDMPNT